MKADTKELSVVKAQVTKAVKAADSIVIKDDEGMLEAGEIRKKIKTVGKMIREAKESITKPINEALKNARAMFAPIEAQYEQAEGIISQKMIEYQNAVEARRRAIEAEAQSKLDQTEERLESGEITERQAMAIESKVEKKLGTAPEVITKSDDFHTRQIKKFRIVNPLMIPRDYLIPDEVAIRKAMNADIAIPGVEYFVEKILV